MFQSLGERRYTGFQRRHVFERGYRIRTDIRIRDFAGPGTSIDHRFPRIYSEHDASQTRSLFFHWPQKSEYFAIYGVFRRDALRNAPLGGRDYRGRPVVTHMEFPILLHVLKHGRIVALPEILRTYRRNRQSTWHRETSDLASVDRIILGLGTKTILLRSALQFPLPVNQKINLIGLTLRNLLGSRLCPGVGKPVSCALSSRNGAVSSHT